MTALLAPLAGLICIPIALINFGLFGSWGRVLFIQERVGRHGQIFRIFKFRTMRGGDGSTEPLEVTTFGRFLRNTHLDELPQLANVLLGDMSLIGPRPEMVPIERWAQLHVPNFAERLAVRPGITGHAQTSQGYAADGDIEAYETKLHLDLEYIASVSPRTDAGIVIRTVIWMLRRRGWRPARQAQAAARS